MHKNARVLILLSVFFMVVGLFSVTEALGMSVSRNVSSVKPGGTVVFTITSPNGYVADVGYSVSNGTIVSAGGSCVGGRCSLVSGQSGVITVKAGQSGSVSLSVSGQASALDGKDYGKEVSVSGGSSVSIIVEQEAKPKPPNNPTKPSPSTPKPSTPKPSTPKPSTPKPSNPNTSNSSTSNSSTSNSSTSKPSTSSKKSPEELKAEEEARKKAAEEEKKAVEEKKKDELKKTPLFSSFDVMSLSDKRFEEVLETVATKFNVFEYEYQLPKNIDRFRLDFEKIDDSVKLEYEKDHEFKDEEKVLSVPVKATKGDVSQSFTIKIKRDDTPVVKQKVDDKEYVVFDDDALDGFMKNLGFKRETVKDGNNFYYEKDKVKLQLLVDDEFNGRWYLLNDKNKIIKPVTVMKLDGDLLVVSEAPEEYRKNTINDEKYEKRSIDYDKSYTEVHPKLNVETSYYSWKVDKGEVVFGMDSSGEEGLYFVSSLKDDVYQIEKAFVGFDKVDGKSQKIAMVSSFAFLGLMSTNLVSYYKKKKRV